MGIMLQVILGMFQFLLLARIPTSHAKVCMHLTPNDSHDLREPMRLISLTYILGGIYWPLAMNCKCIGSGAEHVGLLTELRSRSLTPVTRGSLTGKYAFNTAAEFLRREIPRVVNWPRLCAVNWLLGVLNITHKANSTLRLWDDIFQITEALWLQASINKHLGCHVVK